MIFLYEYRTKDNVHHTGVIRAANRDAVFSALRQQGIRPGSVTEAPGFFNKIFGKGKRWIAIGVLTAVCVGLVFVSVRALRTSHSALRTFEDVTRRQVIGDAAIIEKGIRTGWSEVFPEEGERFLASFAVPGVPAGLRNTSEAEIESALARRIEPTAEDPIEARQIKAMVEGMKQELREYIADGGKIVEYGQRLVARQESELGYYNRVKAEIENAVKSGMGEKQLAELWEERNGSLRRMGVKLVPFPEM